MTPENGHDAYGMLTKTTTKKPIRPPSLACARSVLVLTDYSTSHEWSRLSNQPHLSRLRISSRIWTLNLAGDWQWQTATSSEPVPAATCAASPAGA